MKFEITPQPSEEEIVVITTVLKSLFQGGDSVSKDTPTSDWRFSARWWQDQKFLPKTRLGFPQ